MKDSVSPTKPSDWLEDLKGFTQELTKLKGADASDIHDEEVDDVEEEFSDDKKEAEHKWERREKLRAKHEGRDVIDFSSGFSFDGDFLPYSLGSLACLR